MVTNNHLEKKGHFQTECIRGLQGLADYLGVSRKTAFNIKKQNRLPFYSVGKMIYFRIPEILEAMSSRSSGNLNGK